MFYVIKIYKTSKITKGDGNENIIHKIFDAAVGVDDLENLFARCVDGVAVADAYGPLDASVVLARGVVDGACGESAVGDDDGLIVAGGDDGVEYLYFLDRSGISLGLDEVAYLVH